MAYSHSEVPSLEDKTLTRFLREELRKISEALNEVPDRMSVQELHVEPPKPRDGNIVFADGTDWNPGSGRGYYGYSNGAWVFLG